MLWLKAFHVVFVVAWFAGLFYLPRLFVYHAETRDQAGHERFVVMERRLFIMMTIGGAGTLLTGLMMLGQFAQALPVWLLVKLGLVAVLLVHHMLCLKYLQAFAAGANRHGHRFYRVFNEVPTLVLLGAVFLVVLKPF